MRLRFSVCKVKKGEAVVSAGGREFDEETAERQDEI